MSIGNSPSTPTNNNTTTNNQGAGASSVAGNGTEVYGAQISGVNGSVTTSDYGAIQAGSDIALSGLQTSQAADQELTTLAQQAITSANNLGSQTASGGLTTVIVPALWIAGGVAAIYFLSKFFGKKA